MGGCRVRAAIILIALYLHTQATCGQATSNMDQRKPFFQRLRRLDEQFRRFQEVTLTRLNNIAANYNISYNIDIRFQEMMEMYQNISGVLNEFQSTAANDLNSLKFWTKRLQKKTKKLDLKVIALEKIVTENRKLLRKDNQEQRKALSNITQELQVNKDQMVEIAVHREELQGRLTGLHEYIKKQEKKMSQVEKQMRTMQRLSKGSYTDTKLQKKHSEGRGSKVRLGSRMPTTLPVPTQNTPQPRSILVSGPELEPKQQPELHDLPQLPLRHKIPQVQQVARKAGTICNVKSMLLFPSTLDQNYVTFKKSFKAGIHELSVCTWLKVGADYMGTLLSYATEDNDNKLVLYGRNSTHRGSIDFVISDPAYRELPVTAFLDGDWHHLCIVWSAVEGRFWQYVDRRLISTGSKFQKGYEIPPGGLLVLGNEQDSVGGGFDVAEAFVGRVAGFAMWDRALTPGEVSGIATGKGLPRGHILTLDDVDQLNGSVQLVGCNCLESCI